MPMSLATLALLNGVTAIVLAISSAKPLSRNAPVHLAAVCAALLALSVLAMLVFADRIDKRALLALALGRIAITAALAGAAVTGAGTFMACIALVGTAIWAAAFFSQRELKLVLAANVACVAAAVLLNGDRLRTLADATPILLSSSIAAFVVLSVIDGLRRQAQRDQLTGLLNRYGFDQALREPLGQYRRARQTSLVAIDIDGLKAVNDLQGHLAGDHLLTEFATELVTATGIAGFPARIGGDEFLVVLSGMSAAEATVWADRFRGRSQLSWSYGVAERELDEPLEAWVARADQRMYAAKIAGRTPLSPPTPVS
jgi:diguanylate cyclase (GGDEF)-like protein